MVIRDFKGDGRTFEGPTGDDVGIVKPALGTDRKPVYARNGATRTVAGPTVFNEFYRDTPGVNIPFELHIFFAPHAARPTPHAPRRTMGLRASRVMRSFRSMALVGATTEWL